MRTALLAAGLTLALAAPALADTPAGTYGPDGAYPTDLEQSATATQETNRAPKSDRTRITPVSNDLKAFHGGRGLDDELVNDGEKSLYRATPHVSR